MYRRRDLDRSIARMYSPSWETLPLLPLKCVLEQLCLKDALAATSTCQGWRQGLLLYEGHRDELKLSVKDIQKSIFLAKLFRKHTKRLHIYLDYVEDRLDSFTQHVLSKFYDSAVLSEIVFIGPGYLRLRDCLNAVRLSRPITENLVHAHTGKLKHLALYGCELTPSKYNCTVEEEQKNKRVLSFPGTAQPSFAYFKPNIRGLVFSSLHHLSTEYEALNPEALEDLSTLPHLQYFTLSIKNRLVYQLKPLQWRILDRHYSIVRQVALNIICVPSEKINFIIENVLTEDFPLVAIRVIFCKSLHEPLINHVAQWYKDTLKEFTLADSPYDKCVAYNDEVPSEEYGGINPLIFLCWQCTKLQKLVIHGYSIRQYDVLGIVRLRPTLSQLQISCEQQQLATSHAFISEVNRYLQFPWKPIKRMNMVHPALCPNATDKDRSDYVIKQILQPFGVTHGTTPPQT